MNNPQKPLLVECPTCHVAVIWDEINTNRPFCSERCRNKDLIGWAKEEHRINGDEDYDDLLSDDFPAQ